MLVDIARQFWHYIVEVFPYLALGFLFSGLIQVFVPSDWIARHLGGRGARPLLYATLAGVVLPICCVGSLPVAVSLHDKGARLGPVLSFLVATPATSLPALLVSYGLLGFRFTAYIFVAVIILGLAIGVVGNRLRFKPTGSAAGPTSTTDPVCGRRVDISGPDLIRAEHEGATFYFCCDLCRTTFTRARADYPAVCTNGQCSCQSQARNRLSQALRHAFVTMPRDIGPEILVGLALAAVVAAVTPIGRVSSVNTSQAPSRSQSHCLSAF